MNYLMKVFFICKYTILFVFLKKRYAYFLSCTVALLFIILQKTFFVLSKMAKYVIVYFEKEVEIVSSTWINGNTCFWPPYRYTKLKQSVISHETPAPSWEEHTIRTVKAYGK